MAAEQVSADLEAKRAAADEEILDSQNSPLTPDFLENPMQAIGGGMAKAVFETKDFLFGEPAEEDKWQLRKDIEAKDRALDRKSLGYGISSGVSQFAVGLIGAGKLLRPIKGVKELGKAGATTFEVARGALAGSIVIDPHEERLSDLIESFPALQNPVTEYLQADPADTSAEGRLKNALEGIGLDLAVVGVLGLGLKAIKQVKGGDEASARVTIAEIEKARQANAEAFGLPGTTARIDPEEVLADPAVSAARAANEAEFGLQFPAAAKGEDLPLPSKAADDLASPVAPRTGDPKPSGPEAQTAARNAPTATLEAQAGSPEFVQTSTAKVKPLVPEAKQPEFDLEALSRTVPEDIDALRRFGSRADAVEAGYRFSPSARIPYQKLGTTEERRVFLDAAVAQAQARLDAKKGGDVLSDERVRHTVSQIAEVFNEDPAAVAGMLAQAGDQARSITAKMEAAFLVGQRMFQDAYDVQFRIENGMLDEWGGSIEAAREELRRRLVAALEVTASGNSILANAGRSLRRARASFRIEQADIANVSSMDAAQLSQLVSGTGGDPRKLVQIGSKRLARRVAEGATSLLANNLLWLYPTHLVNVTSNVLMLVGRPTEKLIGGLVLRNSTARKQALKEYVYLTSALSDAWAAAVETFKRGDSQIKPFGDEFLEVGAGAGRDVRVGWQPATSVLNVMANGLKASGIVLGLPTRSLGTVDELVKQMRYRAVVQARAAIEASERGLSGADFKQYVADKLATSFDAEGRAIDAAAMREAQTVTFQNDLDYPTWGGFHSLGAVTRDVRHNVPYTGLILPFVKTPVNVLRYAVKLTPGLNLLQKEYAMALAGKSGKEAQAHAVGQMALGSLFMGTAAVLAAEGRITGGGPENPNLRKELMAQGWKPYSYVVENGDGSKTYIPIGRFDPHGMVFGMVADLMDIMVLHPQRADEAERGLAAVAIALARNFSEKTFLLNLNQTLRALSDPETNAARFAGTLAGNLVPGSSALKGYVNLDPYLREARTVIDHMMKDMPGYSSTLPPQRDVFGEEVWRKRGLTATQDADLVEEEHQRIIEETGAGFSKPQPVREGLDLRDVVLEDGRNAYDKLQELAARPWPGAITLKQALARVIKSNDYQSLVDGPAEVKGTKLYALAGLVSKYRQGAFKRLQSESPLLRSMLRKRQMDVRSELLAKRKSGSQPGETQRLFDALGIRGQER